MGKLVQDLRFAARMLQKSPVSTAVAVLSLALGIGANTVVYSLVDGLVFHPFPYPEPDRLVLVGVVYPRLSPERCTLECLSPPEIEELRSRSRTLRPSAVFDLANSNLSGGEVPERVFTALFWGDPFATLGMRPLHGRGFLPAETTRDSRVAILSHRLWTSRFGADPGLVGRTVEVDGKPVTVVGVMPPRLLLIGTDLWLPMGAPPSTFPRDARRFNLLARLAPGAGLPEAGAELATLAGRIEKEHGRERREYAGWRLEPIPWTEALAGDARPAALLVLGAVAAVLLIACANIASLLLARAASRQREIAVRRALGAGRGRLARQLMTESLLLAVLGGALGLGLAAATLGPVAALLPGGMAEIGLEVHLDGRVLAFTLIAATFAGVLFGLAPAAQAAAGAAGAAEDAAGWLKGAPGQATVSARGRRVRQALLIGEVAFALVLLAGAGLLLKSFARLQRVEPGFDAERVLTLRLTLPRQEYEGAAVAGFFEELVDRVEGIPGVRAAGAASQFPPVNFYADQVEVEGAGAPAAGGALPSADVTVTTAGYLEALGVPLRAGRRLAAGDGEGAPAVAVVNEAAARRLWPGGGPQGASRGGPQGAPRGGRQGWPLGKRLRIGGPGGSPGTREGEQGPWVEVVGVVADVRNHGLDAPPQPEVFLAARQVPGWWNQLYLFIRTEGGPGSVLPQVRAAVAALDRDQPVYAIETLDEVFADTVLERRAAMVLLAAFAGLAVLLAAVGIYGVMAYMVAERTREIGIRMALGAERRAVLGLVVSHALAVVGLGVALGLAGALALGRTVASLLFEVDAHDPPVLVGGAVLLAAVALLACYLPARRASRVSPLVALRQD